MNGGKGNSHGEGGRVRDVESAKSLCPVYSLESFGNTSELRSVDLHSLLDDCRAERGELDYAEMKGGRILPSKGFIKASEDIVARAPAPATTRADDTVSREP